MIVAASFIIAKSCCQAHLASGEHTKSLMTSVAMFISARNFCLASGVSIQR
jgi:hypothetical protein